MIRQLLGTTHHSGVESRMASGLPIYELMEQIRVELRRAVGEEHALLFAEPNPNADTGQIQWYASREGTARPLVGLADEERQAAEVRLAQLTTEIEAHTARLNQSRNPQDQHIAKVLGDALEIPREEDIFVVGGQPVIAAWGHALRGPGAKRQILAALAERVKPSPPPPKPLVPDAGASASTQVDADATDGPAPVAPLATKNEEEEKKRRRFGWLFWLGLLLLILLLALALALLLTRWKCYLYECPPEPPGVPSQPVPSQPAPTGPPPSRDPADVRTPGEAPPVTQPPPGVMACSAATSSGGGQLTRNRHYVGKEPGTVTIGYDMEAVPDELRVYYRGTIVATTERPVSGRGTLSFRYQPEAEFYTVVVEVVSASPSTTWKYTLGCPQ